MPSSVASRIPENSASTKRRTVDLPTPLAPVTRKNMDVGFGFEPKLTSAIRPSRRVKSLIELGGKADAFAVFNVPGCGQHAPAFDIMNSSENLQALRSHALQIATHVTQMHPLVGKIDDLSARGEVLKALFELTKQVEVVKKQVLKLEKRDDSAVV